MGLDVSAQPARHGFVRQSQAMAPRKQRLDLGPIAEVRPAHGKERISDLGRPHQAGLLVGDAEAAAIEERHAEVLRVIGAHDAAA